MSALVAMVADIDLKAAFKGAEIDFIGTKRDPCGQQPCEER